MPGVCSFVLILKPFNVRFFGEYIILNYGDVLLVKCSSMHALRPYSGYFAEVQFDEHMVNSFIHSNSTGKRNHRHGHLRMIKKSFAWPELLTEIVQNINSGDNIHPDFRQAMLFSCFSVFSSESSFIFFLLSDMLSFSGKVRNIFLSDISRAWKLRDVCGYLYMSESLLKRRLLEEKTSFSKLLLEVRVAHAKKLLENRCNVKHVAEHCGYSSMSYFICVFRQYFRMTPRHFLNCCRTGISGKNDFPEIVCLK